MPAQRGADGHRIRPAKVVHAIISGNKERLRELGKAGGAASAKARKAKAEQEKADQDFFRDLYMQDMLEGARRHEEAIMHGIPEHDR